MTTIATKYPFVGCIDSRQGGRNENQDNAGYVDTPLGLLLVVCDGMGGGPGGRTASFMAVETILTVLSDVSEHTPREDALKFAINKANDIIYAKAKETPELRGMGTTVAAILINEKSAIIAHAGDTRIYQLRKGAIVFRSSDHSYVANLVSQKKITEEEARNHPQSNLITRALGIRPSVEIEFDEVAFQRGDRFVLCTDGVWGMMPQRDLVKSLSRVMGINELTVLMTEEIDKLGQENGGGHDNLTLVVLDASFDSNSKNNKKKHQAANGNALENRTSGTSRKYKGFMTFLIVAIIAVIAVSVYFIVLSNDSSAPELPQKGETYTTVDGKPVKIRKEDSNQTDSDRVTHNSIGEKAENLLAINEEIANQIVDVVNSLDSLKKIKEKDKKTAESSKRVFVNNRILPSVNKLDGMVATEKKQTVESVRKMLHAKQTIMSAKNGNPTEEGNNHIDEIIKKVKELKD